LGPKTIENLIQAGFESVQDIVKASIEDLINVPGVGDVTSQKIYLAAVQHMEAVEEKKKQAQAAPAAAAPAPAAEISLPPPPEPPAPALAVDEETIEEPPPIERVKEERVKEERPKEERPKEERPKEREKKQPQPVASEPAAEPVTAASEPKARPEGSGNYLDDIAAMESELSSGWEGDEEEPKDS
jgi:outer membrane biosynthesis protein TonB